MKPKIGKELSGITYSEDFTTFGDAPTVGSDAPSEQELARRQGIIDVYNAPREAERKAAQDANQKIAEDRERDQRERDIQEYMSRYCVSREKAESNLGWYRAEGRAALDKIASGYIREVF